MMTPVSKGFTETHVPGAGATPSGRATCLGSSTGDAARFVVIALALTALMLGSGSILVLSAWCGAFLAFISFAVLLMLSSTTWRSTWYVTLALLASQLVCAYFALRIDCVVLRLILLSWLLLVLEIKRPVSGSGAYVPRDAAPLASLAWGALGYACLLSCYERSDIVWFALRRVSGFGTGNTSIGVWVSGLPIYLFGFVALIPEVVMGPRRRWGIVGALVLFGAFAGGRALIPVVAPVGPAKVAIVHGASVILVSLVLLRIPRAIPDRRRLVSVSAGLTLLALCLVLATRLQQPPRPGCHGSGYSTALYSQGLLDWRTPDLETPGLINSGMFGLFRRELEQRARCGGGHAVPADSITDDLLSNVHALVFINPSRCPQPTEVSRIEQFVRAGGGLLVLGDHTDIGGSLKPLNTILGFTNIRFNFDSAIPLRENWYGCLEIRNRALGVSLRDEVMLQMAVGASLSIERPAFPVVTARYGFSDAGDPSNGGRGAFMGDVTHEGGEPVGDLVLAAGQISGLGRVLVLGDTSPFQNGALFLSRGFVTDAMAWVVGGHGGRPGGEADSSPPYCDNPVAIVDFSLKPRASLELFDGRALGGLANCLARAGVIAVPAVSGRDWTYDAAYLFLISPTQSIDTAQTDWLLGYMASGGNVILSESYATPQPSAALLSQMGLSLRPIPLGGGSDASPAEHKEAWAVSLEDTAKVEVRVRAFGYPTIVTKRVGAGSFTLIGDSRFLLDENLENEWQGSMKNINFVTGLVSDLKKPTEHAGISTN
jgi:hypothetical protein